MTDTFTTAHQLWAAARLQALTAEDGWLDLTDRVEIAPGRYRTGRAAGNDLQISAGPEVLGVLELAEDGSATFDSGQGPEAFVAEAEGPPRLKAGGLLLEIHSLEGQAALRVRDPSDPRRTAFAGIDSFALDPAWRITAVWEALPAPQALRIGTVVGVDTSVKLTHRARFSHEGHEVTLLATHWKGGAPMFVIRDATSGKETYGAARFLIGEVTGDSVVLDFNRAINPPCAFTDFATCPLPPRENFLPFAIQAGEKRPD